MVKFVLWVLLLSIANWSLAEGLRINQLQFVGSHNSYKKAMLPEHMAALEDLDPQAAAALAYAHIPLNEQLDSGIRKLELDLFYEPGSDDFVVGHIQVIDMQTHCATLRACLRQLKSWSLLNPGHIPVWISFNAKDSSVEGLPDPHLFDLVAFSSLDALLVEELGAKLILPQKILTDSGPVWPYIDDVRGTFLVVLDEGGRKRELYLEGDKHRVMFTTVAPPHRAAAIQIINDPVDDFSLIQSRVRAGYMVRTRADANTLEARIPDTVRRSKAFASGAQAISTDYYQDSNPFQTDYSVKPVISCNPVTGLTCSTNQTIE